MTVWPTGYSKLTVMFKKPVRDDFSFVTWGVILLKQPLTVRCTMMKRGGYYQEQPFSYYKIDLGAESVTIGTIGKHYFIL